MSTNLHNSAVQWKYQNTSAMNCIQTMDHGMQSRPFFAIGAMLNPTE